ncbi:MAG: hypothetical protein LC104_06515 [Bacteroidales bacterium]|nr:hypothetical protein [Bacteroidales bacterium]
MSCRIAILAAFLCVVPANAADKPQLQAGAFAQDVTPKSFPISVNGGMSDRQATGAHDPIHARCLVLDDGTTKLAIVVVDSCMVPRKLMDAAKAKAAAKTGIPAENMLISATHTHTAPSSTGVFQSDADKGYVAFLTEKIAEGIEKAHAARVPAEAGWGVAEEPSQVFNRRWFLKPGTLITDPFGNTTDQVRMNPGIGNPDLVKPAGPVDPQVSILSVRTAKTHKPIALLANYSLHYVGDMPALSADYFGVFAELIGQKIGAEPGFVGIMSNGTSGDVNNINFRKAHPKTGVGERSRLVADLVANAALKAYQSAKHRSDISLDVATTELEFKVRKPKPDEVEKAKEILAGAKGRVLRGLTEVYARETVLINEYPDTVKSRMQAMRVGELGIAAIPCETFTEIGLAIKEKSPLKPTFTISLANGYNGYLPTPKHHALGGYETWRARSSYLEVGASDRIIPTILKLLGDVAKK